jgi:CheY-like chemotaxis protein
MCAPEGWPAERIRGRLSLVTRILVVDDNEDSADMLAAVLEGRGHELRVAHDPETALRIAVEFAPNVAFLDLGLPEMDGYELATRLRALPGLAELRLIALTGFSQASAREKSREAGFDHHLVKPVQLQAIEASLTP